MTTKAPPKPKPDVSIDLSWLIAFTPDLSDYRDDLVAELTRAFIAAYQAAAPDLPAGQSMQDRAAEWALNRAGELVTDISETTRDEIAEMASSAVSDGLSIGQLASALRDSLAFGRDRAETIARTETATALGRGQRAAAIDQQQDEMQWVAGNCDYCIENAGDGWIGIGETFSSGDDNIPAHPNCTCTVIYRTRRVHEDAAVVPLVKEARCPQCKRKLGEHVNRGARLHCGRCREVVEVA